MTDGKKQIKKKEDDMIVNSVGEQKVPDESVKEVEKPVKVKEFVKEPFDVKKKIQTIEASSMPNWQKEEYIKRLLPEKVKSGIPFNVYAKLKELSPTVAEAMKAYPDVSGVGLATVEEWDKIFKGF